MKIGVMSDTHLRTPDASLGYILEDLLSDADLILHAGDIVTREVLDFLEERGVVAVCGNMDDYDVALAVPQTRIIPTAGKRIGLVHGWGSKEGLARRVLTRFGPEKLDLIVYGHSHVPFWGQVDGTYMFNPGSAAHNRYGGHATVGVIDIAADAVTGKFLSVDR